MLSEIVDVAIVGAGPAGLASAIKAKEAGAERVVVIDRAEAPGGLLDQCVHNGFGLLYFQEDLTGPEFAYRLTEKALDLGVDMQLETMALALEPDKKLTVCSRKGIATLEAKAVVLAMGCRERTRESIMIPGERPAGIFTAGTAQRYVNVEGFIPGKEIVVLGSGDVGMIMARRLTLEGAKVKAVVEVLPYVGGLIRNEVQCLVDFDIPVLLEHTVIAVHGRQRVESVTVARITQDMEPIPGSEKAIECDTLLLSVGLIPENELSQMAGVRLDPLTGGPFVDEKRQTCVPGIFAAGNVVHVHDLVDYVTWDGEIAGSYAAQYALGRSQHKEHVLNVRPGEGIRYVVPQQINTETNAETAVLYARVKEPAENVLITVGDIFKRRFRAVKPSEMVRIELPTEELRKTSEDTVTLSVSH